MCVCVCVCVCARARVCVCVCVRACVCVSRIEIGGLQSTLTPSTTHPQRSWFALKLSRTRFYVTHHNTSPTDRRRKVQC